MQDKPHGWPAEGPVEDLPEFLVVADEVWAPGGSAATSALSIRRELVGGGLPGAARGGSGFSVADGNITVPQSAGAPFSPWAGAAQRVTPGNEAKIVASHDTARLALGSFIVASIEGADSSGTLTIPLIESQRSLDGPCTYVWQYDAAQPVMDASEVIRAIASSAGYDTDLIEDSGSMIRGLFDVAGKSNRDVIQDIARATMGAAWQDETGRLVYRNAESMRTGYPVETVVADSQLEDVPWRISREDTADRIALTYTPVEVIADGSGSITLWEATDPVRVPAGRSISIVATINGSTDRIAPWYPIWDATLADTRMSRWAAAATIDGGGTRPADDALRFDTKMTGPSTVMITVTNRTENNLWLVDGNGAPCLILRSTRHVAPGEQMTISAGADEAMAVNGFDFDCGGWVQDAARAQSMLDWLWAQMSFPLGVIPSVSVKPNLARQLGDIITITEEKLAPDHVPLKSKALVTGMDLDADGGGYTQTLSLALLAVTFHDFDVWGIGNAVETFEQFDARLSAAGISTFEQFDLWASRVLVPTP